MRSTHKLLSWLSVSECRKRRDGKKLLLVHRLQKESNDIFNPSLSFADISTNMMKRTRLFLSLLSLAIATTLAIPIEAKAEADKAIVRAVKSSALQGGVSIWIGSSDGEVLFSRDEEVLRVPASTMKIITAATSLHTMSPQRVFPTIVQEGGAAKEIHLVGGGDPTLSVESLRMLAQETAKNLRKQKKRKVLVHADVSLFPPPRDAPGWLEEDSPTYAAEVGPLARLGVYSNEPWRDSIKIFVNMLREEGIRAQEGTKKSVPSKTGLVLASTVGAQLQEAIGLMLRVSENNISEILFRQVALSSGQKPTWRGSRLAAEQALQDLGFEVGEQIIVDGSGLSPSNRLDVELLVDILLAAAPGGKAKLRPLQDLLPISGVSGTLVNRFTGNALCARGRVWAKTGSLTGVNTLAGLTKTTGGSWRAFAVLVNGWDGSQASWSETSAAIDAVAAATYGCLPTRRR